MKKYQIQSYVSQYETVFEGFDLEIQIVNHCHLNCSGCNHFTPLADPYYMSLEEFEDNLKLVKAKLPTLKYLMLVGGEPTLHPQLLELCQIARNLFPDIIIDILTNGIILNSWNKENFYPFIKLKSCFCVSEYYNQDYTNLKTLINNPDLESVFTKRQISRFLFSTDLIDVNGQQDNKKTFFNCSKHVLPCFTLKDKKIFICPFAAHIEHFCKKFNKNIPIIPNDYLDLTKNITLQDLQDFCFKEKNICKYCRDGEPAIWNKANYLEEDYTQSTKELFLNNYDLYQEKINNLNYLKMINDPQYKSIDFKFFTKFVNKLERRFKTGIIDIIIPYYKIKKDLFQKCFESLKNQTIIDQCNIYLVSDQSPDEEYVYDLFVDSGLNVIFLKNKTNKGPGIAKNNGIDNSFSPYLCFLDSDDYYLLEDNLEQLYTLALKNSEKNVIYGKDYMEMEKKEEYFGHNRLFKRNFIERNKIQFGPLYINEDCYFDCLLETCDGYDALKTDIVGYYYSANQTPINDNSMQLILTNCIVDVLITVNRFQRDRTFQGQEFAIKNFFLGRFFERMLENQCFNNNSEIQEVLLLKAYLSLILIQNEELKNMLLNLEEDNQISLFIKDVIFNENYNIIINGTIFSTNQIEFLTKMEEKIINNKNYSKVLPEAKNLIFSYLKEGWQ